MRNIQSIFLGLGLIPASLVMSETANAGEFGYFYPKEAERKDRESGKGETDPRPSAQGPKKSVIVPLKSTNIPVIGSAFNLISGMPVPSNCLSAFETKPNTLNDITQKLSQSIDTESTYYKLNQTVSAKGSYGEFGGSGSYSSTDETKTSYTGTTLVVSARIERNAQSISFGNSADGEAQILDLNDQAASFLKDDGYWAFRARCGDGYVRAIVTGTEMYAVANLEETSYEQKKSVEKAASASYGGDLFTAEGSSTLQQEIKRTSQDLGIESWTRGSAQEQLATNLDELKLLYQQLPSLDAGSSRPLYAVVEIYSELPSVGVTPYPFVEFEGLNQSSIRLSFLRDTIFAAIEENSSPQPSNSFLFYPGKSADENYEALTSLMSGIDERLEQLNGELANCYADAQLCDYPVEARLHDLKMEYITRAQMPIAKSGIPSDVMATVKRQMATGDAIQQKNAISTFSEYLFADNILRAERLRCESRKECLSADMLSEIAAKICETAGGSRGWEGSLPRYLVCDYGSESPLLVEGAEATGQLAIDITDANAGASWEITGGKTIVINVPKGVVPSIILKAHAGIIQFVNIDYFEGDTQIDTARVRIARNDFAQKPPRFFQRALSSENRLEITTWGEPRPLSGGRIELSDVREAKTWGTEFLFSFESDDWWANRTWDDVRIGYNHNLATEEDEDLEGLDRVATTLVTSSSDTSGNDANVGVGPGEIFEDGSPTAKVRFEFATADCETRRVTGTFEFTAIYQDVDGSTSEKIWKRGFDGYGPVWTEFVYPSVGGGEKLSDVADAMVVDSSC